MAISGDLSPFATGENHISALGTDLEVRSSGPRPAQLIDVGAEVWRDPEGAVQARSYIQNGCAWIDIPGTALFRFGLTTRKTTAFPDPTASPELIFETYLRVVLPIGLSYSGHEVLHASAVLGKAGIAGFCAPSGTGKSTLATAFCRQNYRAFADDALVLDFQLLPERITAISVPFSIRLAADSELRDARITAVGTETVAPVAGLYALERGPVPPSEPKVIRLRPGDALAALLPHTYHLSLGDAERKRAILSRYLELVSRVQVYKVIFSPEFSCLPALVKAIEQTFPSCT